MAKKVKQEEKPMGWKDVLPVIGVGLVLILISVIGISARIIPSGMSITILPMCA